MTSCSKVVTSSPAISAAGGEQALDVSLVDEDARAGRTGALGRRDAVDQHGRARIDAIGDDFESGQRRDEDLGALDEATEGGIELADRGFDRLLEVFAR